MRHLNQTAAVLASLAGLAAPAAAQWSSDPATNLALADRTGEQVQGKIVAIPGGGYWVSWFDNATGGYDVYLQRLNADGTEAFAHNGLLVADRGFSSTQDYGLAVDADGNAYLAYRDDRSGSVRTTLTKVAPDGTFVWGDGPTFDADFIGNPRVAPLADGGAVVGWSESASFRLHRVNAQGEPVWGETGVEVAEADRLLTLSDLKPSDDGTVIALTVRTATSFFLSPKGLSVQKFDADGNALWNGGDLVTVYSPDEAGQSIQMGYFPTFENDGEGGAVVTWYDNGDTRNAWVQHVRSDGSLVFAGNGLAASGDPSLIRVSAEGAYDPAGGEYYVGFMTATLNQSMWGYRVQKFSADGVAQWGDGLILDPLDAAQPTPAKIVWSGDGVIAAWGDGHLLAARIDADGSDAWGGPIAASSRESPKSRIALAPAPKGGAVVVWSDGDFGAADLLAQNINADGSLGTEPCAADFDGSGTADVNDLLGFLGAFRTQGPGSDFDGNGSVDVNDLLGFLGAFRAGC